MRMILALAKAVREWYRQHRVAVLSAKIRKGATRCPYCQREMHFPGLESWASFEERPYQDRGALPSKWPAKMQKKKATLDHLLPIKRGGGDHGANLTIMCAGCNEDKASKTPPEWIRARKDAGRPLTEASARYLLVRWSNACKYYRRKIAKKKERDMTTKTTEATAKDPVDLMDFTRPWFCTVRQTESGRMIENYVQGSDDEEDLGFQNVVEHATEEAARIKAPVMVFGPQRGVIQPPKPKPPEFVGMDFTKPTEG